ncbi:MAG: hypothetical protein ACE367_14870 [Acidimicrobiales bacterium]
MTTEPEPTVELDITAELDAETRARIARLQARRGASGAPGSRSNGPAATAAPGRRRRRHPAKNSRIAATAFGLSAMFGLVAAYGVAAQAAGPELTEIAPPAQAREPIVIQLRLVGLDATPAAAPVSTPAASGGAPAEQAPSAAAPAPPVATAAPQVRVLTAPAAAAPPAPAPVEASTNGSR